MPYLLLIMPAAIIAAGLASALIMRREQKKLEEKIEKEMLEYHLAMIMLASTMCDIDTKKGDK